MNVNFSKLTAAGNDFILIDNRNAIVSKLKYEFFAKKFCNRRYSIGADGLIFVEGSIHNDFKMKYLNSDGSCASMCGNGGRSVAKFAYSLGIVGPKMIFETDAGLVNAEILSKDIVKLGLYSPKDLKLNIDVEIECKKFNVDFINTGVPHAVVFVDDIENIDILKYGKVIRYHKIFAPDGVNVNFVKIIENNTLFVRTYERGVEDETLACGTGITASGIISVIKNFAKSPVNIIARGGDMLSVSFKNVNNEISDVILKGPAIVAFKGIIEI
ncbi:MAG: diaminopimelate epimerase [Endomicrobium sp.]|jgi:diaminopimelate epimerase|nr:diaminopimelate epimerase [Endomicrobium sp.]